MRLGLDIDGVCLDFIQGMRDILGKNYPSPTVWNMIDEWGYTDDPVGWNAAIREAQYATDESASSYWMLSNKDMAAIEDHELYIITARRPDQMPGIIREFSYHNLNVQGAIFSAGSGKPVWCDKLLLTAMIEDRAETAMEFTGGKVPCFLLNKSWNQNQIWGRRVDTVAQFPDAVLKGLGAVVAGSPPVAVPPSPTRSPAPAA